MWMIHFLSCLSLYGSLLLSIPPHTHAQTNTRKTSFTFDIIFFFSLRSRCCHLGPCRAFDRAILLQIFHCEHISRRNKTEFGWSEWICRMLGVMRILWFNGCKIGWQLSLHLQSTHSVNFIRTFAILFSCFLLLCELFGEWIYVVFLPAQLCFSPVHSA